MRNVYTFETLRVADGVPTVRQGAARISEAGGMNVSYEDEDRAIQLQAYVNDCLWIAPHLRSDIPREEFVGLARLLDPFVDLESRLRTGCRGRPFSTLASTRYVADLTDPIATHLRDRFCQEESNFVLFETKALGIVECDRLEDVSPQELGETFLADFLESCPERRMLSVLYLAYCPEHHGFHVSLRGLAVDDAASYVRLLPSRNLHTFDSFGDVGRNVTTDWLDVAFLNTFKLFSLEDVAARCNRCADAVEQGYGGDDQIPASAAGAMLVWLDRWTLDDMIFVKGISALNGRVLAN